ncbi:Bro-N domain-containing protein [Rhodoplanes sp. SY1]|uniref:BRO-N domain-containing protein n=1 Tax=Rhodoplanes sp. SY1 TaxID=3166646 RepID=UPI0038B5B860
MRGSTPINVLAEAGLYRLLSLSRKPIAEPFKDWLYREVLPAIRKTGGYVLAGADPATVEVGATEMMPLPATFTEALRQHAATLIRLAEERGALRRRDWEAHARTQAEKQAAEIG